MKILDVQRNYEIRVTSVVYSLSLQQKVHGEVRVHFILQVSESIDGLLRRCVSSLWTIIFQRRDGF